MKPLHAELCGPELRTSYYSLKQIIAATNNFNPTNKLGEGGFGPVYKVYSSISKLIFPFLPLCCILIIFWSKLLSIKNIILVVFDPKMQLSWCGVCCEMVL